MSSLLVTQAHSCSSDTDARGEPKASAFQAQSWALSKKPQTANDLRRIFHSLNVVGLNVAEISVRTLAKRLSSMCRSVPQICSPTPLRIQWCFHSSSTPYKGRVCLFEALSCRLRNRHDWWPLQSGQPHRPEAAEKENPIVVVVNLSGELMPTAFEVEEQFTGRFRAREHSRILRMPSLRPCCSTHPTAAGLY